MRDAKKTKDLLDSIPSNLGFVSKKEDILHTIIDIGGRNLQDFDNEINRTTDNLFIDKANPAYPHKIYYVNQIVLSTDIFSGVTKVVDNRDTFLSMDITGLDKVGEIPVSVTDFPNGIIGLSFGFDWENPALYVTSGNNFIHVFTDIAAPGVTPFKTLPIILPDTGHTLTNFDYTIVKQDYDSLGYDEYLIMKTETVVIKFAGNPVYLVYDAYGVGKNEHIFDGDASLDMVGDCLYFFDANYYIKAATYTAGQWHITFFSALISTPFGTQFLLKGDRKVTYLTYEPVQNLIITDVMNLKDPNISDSPGIIVSDTDYTVEENKIIFDKIRSDYQPSTIVDGEIVYPVDYQPDTAFRSTYIAEYDYRNLNLPRYLTQRTYMHDIGIKEIPVPSIQKT